MRNHLWSGGFFKWEEDNKPDSNYIYINNNLCYTQKYIRHMIMVM